MPLLPNQIHLNEYMNTRQIWVLDSLQWTLIILNSLLLVMLAVNFWIIFVRRGKWRTVPLLLFYIISLISVLMRLIATIW